MKIESYLKQVEHNPHYLNRYIKFISIFNRSGTVEHHALPKSMFPKFSNLKKNPWNNCKLGFREHYIAHWLLWKAFPNNLSMFKAFWGMTNKDGHKINSKTYSILRHQHVQWNIDTKSSLVTAKNLITGETKQIERELFETSKEWAGVNKGNKKLSKTMSENRKNGTIPTWNKGIEFRPNISEEGKLRRAEGGKKKPSAETKKLMSKSMSSKPRICCPDCGKEVAEHHLNRHLKACSSNH